MFFFFFFPHRPMATDYFLMVVCKFKYLAYIVYEALNILAAHLRLQIILHLNLFILSTFWILSCALREKFCYKMNLFSRFYKNYLTIHFQLSLQDLAFTFQERFICMSKKWFIPCKVKVQYSPWLFLSIWWRFFLSFFLMIL